MKPKKTDKKVKKKNIVFKMVVKPIDDEPYDDYFTLTDVDNFFLHQHAKLKLQIELVPDSCIYSNVRAIIKRSQWDKLRKKIGEKSNFLCEICGGKGTLHPVECHEVWIYDEKVKTQRLNFLQSPAPQDLQSCGITAPNTYAVNFSLAV